MKKLLALILSTFLLLSCLTACSTKAITVCYTIYPVEYLLNRIAEKYVNTCNLSQAEVPIQVAHIADDYADSLDKADLILQVGDLEPYWEIYESEIKSSKAEIIDLSGLAGIYDFKRYTTGTVSGSSVTVESNWYEGSAFSSIDMYSKDLGLWLDPIAMSSMARTIKDWLVEKDPNNSGVYEANFTALEADLVRLDSEYSAISSQKLSLVTVTPSFGNWQKDYNVGIYPLILSRYGALPNDEQLKIIEDRIKNDKVKYIVYESNMTEDMIKLYEQVKNDCGLTEVDLSNLSSLTEKEYNQNKDYLTIMYDNLNKLEALK